MGTKSISSMDTLSQQQHTTHILAHVLWLVLVILPRLPTGRNKIITSSDWPEENHDLFLDALICGCETITSYHPNKTHTARRKPRKGVLISLKFYWVSDIVEFVLGRFSHFYISILPIQTLHSVAPELQVFVSSLEKGTNFRKTSTPQRSNKALFCNKYCTLPQNHPCPTPTRTSGPLTLHLPSSWK